MEPVVADEAKSAMTKTRPEMGDISKNNGVSFIPRLRRMGIEKARRGKSNYASDHHVTFPIQGTKRYAILYVHSSGKV